MVVEVVVEAVVEAEEAEAEAAEREVGGEPAVAEEAEAKVEAEASEASEAAAAAAAVEEAEEAAVASSSSLPASSCPSSSSLSPASLSPASLSSASPFFFFLLLLFLLGRCLPSPLRAPAASVPSATSTPAPSRGAPSGRLSFTPNFPATLKRGTDRRSLLAWAESASSNYLTTTAGNTSNLGCFDGKAIDLTGGGTNNWNGEIAWRFTGDNAYSINEITIATQIRSTNPGSASAGSLYEDMDGYSYRGIVVEVYGSNDNVTSRNQSGVSWTRLNSAFCNLVLGGGPQKNPSQTTHPEELPLAMGRSDYPPRRPLFGRGWV